MTNPPKNGTIKCVISAHIRDEIAKKLDIDSDAVFITASHIHTGPKAPGITDIKYVYGKTLEELLDDEYTRFFVKRLTDLASLAADDLAPAKMLYTYGEVKDVSFIRRYKMTDGTIRTNPGWQNPDIVEACDTPDEESSLLIIKREGKKEIGIVNFQVHPDLIGRTKYTADYPKFVRDTYEANIPNSLCMYINGAQGDSNHIDVRLDPAKDLVRGYERSRYMGKKIAMSVVSNYELAKEINGDKVNFATKIIQVKYNKGTAEEYPIAEDIAKRYYRDGLNDVELPEADFPQKTRIGIVTWATRIYGLQSMPEYKELILTAVSVGDVVFAGFPGEPFTEIGRQVKNNSPFALTIPACAANGYEGYYPMMDAFAENGYEADASRYVAGTAEKLIEASLETIKSLK